MNVVIIEDERLTARRLESLLHRYDPTLTVLTSLPSIGEAVPWFRGQASAGVPVDLVFMDIHLQDGLAFTIIDQVGLTTPVIFTTAYDEYMVQAFKVTSIDYLLKPIQYDDLAGAIDKFKGLRLRFTQAETAGPPPGRDELDALMHLLTKPKTGAYKNRFMITLGPKIYSIETADTAYFYVNERATFLVTTDGRSLPVEYSLDKLAQLLDPEQFFRTSRQFLIARSALHTVTAYSEGKLKVDVRPAPPAEVFVSAERMAAFKEWLGK